MAQNRTKARLAEGGAVFGCPLTMDAPSLVELLGSAGLDFVMIDCEAGPMTPGQVESMVRAAELTGITPLVRVVANRPEIILRYLDRGALGIVVPHVNTRQEAEEAVAAVKYPPQGRRGFSPARWTLAYRGEEDIFAAANRETLVVCMVEEREGAQNLREIASVPGVDVVLIGPNDLALSLGHAGQTWHPEVVELTDEAVATVTGMGNPRPAMGLGGLPPTEPGRYHQYRQKGVRYFTVSLNGIVTGALRYFLGEVRG